MTFRAPVWQRVNGVILVLMGLSNSRVHWGFGAATIPFGLAWSYVAWRTLVTADPAGVTVRRTWRSRRVAWSDVAEIRRTGGLVHLVTRDGERVPLPWVDARATVPSDPRYVYPRSGQALAMYAREAGQDVPYSDGSSPRATPN